MIDGVGGGLCVRTVVAPFPIGGTDERALHHLGLTRGGAPRHPLYIAYAEPPRPWQG